MDYEIMFIKVAIMNIEVISCALNSILFWNATNSCTTEFGYNEYAAYNKCSYANKITNQITNANQ